MTTQTLKSFLAEHEVQLLDFCESKTSTYEGSKTKVVYMTLSKTVDNCAVAIFCKKIGTAAKACKTDKAFSDLVSSADVELSEPREDGSRVLWIKNPAQRKVLRRITIG